MYLHLWENTYVPSFFPKGFLGFRIRQIHLKSVPAYHRPKQGLRLVIIIIVFCPGKLIGCPGYIFHDLGRIHASLFRIPRCSKFMSLGLVVLILSLASAPIACLACPQHMRLRLTSIKLAVLDGAISHNSLCPLLCLFFLTDTTLFHACPASVWALFYFQSGWILTPPFVT